MGDMRPRDPIVLIAPDSFKGCMSAARAAACMARGLRTVWPDAEFRLVPMADGGEGTVEAMVAATGGRLARAWVRDPLGRRVRAVYGLLGDGRTAVIEMAAASGLMLLTPRERNPLLTTTLGTGDLIRAALDAGARELVLAIGGSATTDGGAGMAQALGIRLCDRRGRELPGGGGALSRLERIDVSGLDPRLAACRIRVACDVDNPLTGPRGAARIYGPQKGATPAMVKQLDANLSRLAACMARDLGRRVARVPGAGAAGGLGAGLLGFLKAELQPGVDMVVDAVGLEAHMRGCTLVVTGEGRLDGQTLNGKTPAGVARVAGRLGLPVVAVCGRVGPGVERLQRVGITAYVASRAEPPLTEAELPRLGPGRVTEAAALLGRLLAAGVSGACESAPRNARRRRLRD